MKWNGIVDGRAREDPANGRGIWNIFRTSGRSDGRKEILSRRKWDTQLKRRFRYKRRQYLTIGLASKVVNLFLAQLKTVTQWESKTKRNEKSASLGKPARVQCSAQEQRRDTSHSSKDTSIAKWFYVCQSIKAHKTQSGFVCSEMCVCVSVSVRGVSDSGWRGAAQRLRGQW